MAKKERADILITQAGLAKSRTHAQALIMAGQVCLGDQLVQKPSDKFDTDSVFRLKEGAAAKYVSRGGEKLEGALRDFSFSVSGLTALDVGMSTGGFTDCLLQGGAAKVIGLDVGHNQLDWKLRNDPRVTFYEKVNARSIAPELIPAPVDLVVIDVSFISLSLILPEVVKFLKPNGVLIALIKPQFEVGKDDVGKGGLVKDPLLHEAVQEKIKTLCQQLGFDQLALTASPIEGTDGNKEFFIFGRWTESHAERVSNKTNKA
ncbi:MAG: TlyA family RNA methyltransferase [Oligoflexia bacterium]|nr:TlyA family RNA methyltransferase [Oligoflexia bacterium]